MTGQLIDQQTQVQLTSPTSPAARGRLRAGLHRIGLTIREMNAASRRLGELQAPWIVDTHWDSK